MNQGLVVYTWLVEHILYSIDSGGKGVREGLQNYKKIEVYLGKL